MKRFYLTMILLVVLAISVHAAIPEMISFQGRLSDTQGLPLTGSYNLTFRLYDVSTGGAALWTEAQTSISITNGLFSVFLGSQTAMSGVSFDTGYFISIEVNGNGEMSPRIRLTASGFAFKSKFSDTAYALSGNITIDSNLTVSGNLVADTMTVTDTVYATAFVGDGSGLSGVNAGKFSGTVNDSIYVTETNIGIGTGAPNDSLTIQGGVSLAEISAPSNTSGYGKMYVKSSDNDLYFQNSTGQEFNITDFSSTYAYESEWIYVDVISASTEVVFPHNFGFVPAQVEVLQCGDVTNGLPATRVVNCGNRGFQAGGTLVNPRTVSADSQNIYVEVVTGWWAWGYYNGAHTLVQTDDEDANLETAYYKVIATNSSSNDTGTDNMGNHIATNNIQLGTNWLSGDGGNEGVYVASDGDVGIGTSSPTDELTVFSTAENVAANIVTASSSDSFLMLYSGKNNVDAAVVYGLNQELKIGTYTDLTTPTFTERMRIDSSGNVGIGSASPSDSLTIVGTLSLSSMGGVTDMSAQTTSDNDFNFKFGRNSSDVGQIRTSSNGFEFAAMSNNSVLITDDAGNGITVEDGGYTGIGTSDPSSPLHIYTSSATPIRLNRTTANNVNIEYANGADTLYAGITSQGSFAIGLFADLSNKGYFNVTEAENVGIGTNAPSDSLQVLGGILAETMTITDTIYAAAFVGDGSGLTNLNSSATGWSVGGDSVYKSTGGIGIGTTTPESFLHFNKPGKDIIIKGQGSSSNNTINLYEPGTADFKIKTNWTAADIYLETYGGTLFINQDGAVGIGTTSPVGKLTIRGNSTQVQLLESDNSDKSWHMEVNNEDLCFVETSVSERMRLDKTTGYLGVGTNTPLGSAHIKGGSGDTPVIIEFSSVGSESVALDLQGPTVGGAAVAINFGLDATGSITTPAGSNYRSLARITGQQVSSSGMHLQFQTKSDESDELSTRMHIDKDGNVGIGTTTPKERLHVISESSGTDDGISVSYYDATYPALRGIINHTGNTYGVSITAQGADNSTAGSGDISFHTSNSNSADGYTDAAVTEKMRIKYNGNVGIGTTNPATLFQVGAADASNGAIITVCGDATSSPEGGQITLETAADHDATYAGWNIDVYEDDVRVFIEGGGNPGATILAGNTSWSAMSDIRVKKDVVPLENVLDKLDKINGGKIESGHLVQNKGIITL